MPSRSMLLRLFFLSVLCCPPALAEPGESIDCPAGTVLRAKPASDDEEQWEQWCEDLWTGRRHGFYRRFEAGRFGKDYGVLEFGQYWQGRRVGRWGHREAGSVPSRFEPREHRLGTCRGDWNWIRDGHWIEWWHNGRKRTEGEFSDCARSGRWREWDASGPLTGEQTYWHGEVEGESRAWFEWGKPRMRLIYEGGRVVEITEIRDSNDRLEYRFERRDAVGTGFLFTYDNDWPASAGSFLSPPRRHSIARYENGVPHGRTTTFDSRGRRRLSIVYRDGEPRGAVTYWHANGTVAARGEYQGTERVHVGCGWEGMPVLHGTWREWDESGRLLWQAEYDHGELLSCVLIGREKPSFGHGCRLTPSVELGLW